MRKFRTVRELLDSPELGKIRRISEEVLAASRQVDQDLSRMHRNSRSSHINMLPVHLGPRGRICVDKWARAWRIPKSALVRIALWKLGYDLGFDVEGMMIRKDELALDRYERMPKPFDDKATVDKKREDKRARIFTLEQGTEEEIEALLADSDVP